MNNAPMNIDQFTHRLSDYIDGELDGRVRDEVQRHIAACAACRTTVEELRAVVARATSLQDTAPAGDLWTGVAARIAPAAARPSRIALFARALTARRFTFSLPQLAAAALALMVLSGGLVWMARSGDPRADFQPISAREEPAGVIPANIADARDDDAVADLQRALDEGRSKLDPDTVRTVEESVAVVDRAIDECQRALATDPANVYLHTHLAETRQRKLALLRRAIALANSGR